MDWHSARTFRRCARKDRQQPILYTNFLLRCFIHSIAVCLSNSLMVTSLALDGIPLAHKYLKILSLGLENNRNLRSLSLAKCRIGDTGCDILLESLQNNSSLHILNLSSCCLTNRSATCLSLFFKKRKADLLKNVWKESTLLQDYVRNTKEEEGLQVLILDRNYKFGNVGLQQLIRMLKNDFWLKKLCLRHCGITQHGGEIMLQLLQTNSMLTHIDLRDNDVPVDILQTIRKILKKRRSKGERIPMKKRLIKRKHIVIPNMISKNTSSQRALKENEFSRNQTQLQLEMQHDCNLQIRRPIDVRKKRRDSNRNCKMRSAAKRNHIEWSNVDELKKCLSFMIERNQNLITILENSADFLIMEKNRRLSAEVAYHKIQPRLRNLKNKIAMQNSVNLYMRYENQAYTNLRNLFNELNISTSGEILRMDRRSLEEEEASKNRIKSIVPYRKN